MNHHKRTPHVGCWILHLGPSQHFSASGWKTLLDVPREPTSLAAWLESVQPADRVAIQAALAQSSLTEEGFQLNFHVITTTPPARLLTLDVKKLAQPNGHACLVASCVESATSAATSLTTSSASQDTAAQNAPCYSITNAAPMLIWTTDAAGNCNWCNRQWLEFTGSTQASALGQGRYASTHPDDQEPAASAFLAALAQRDTIELEYRMKTSQGDYSWMLERSSPRYDSDNTFLGYVGVCADITQQYELRQRMADRELVMQQLHDISERERTFLSCTIHDGLLQDIIGADMVLHGCEEMEREQLGARLAMAHRVIASAIGHGRRLISELRPMILDERGLTSSIEFYVAEIQSRSQLHHVEVINQLERDIHSPLWSGNAFRIVQEALNNAEAHSQAEHITVTLSERDQRLYIQVVDDGQGFNLADHQESFGLRCIRERTEIFDGSVEIKTAVGEGTAVNFVLPLPRYS